MANSESEGKCAVCATSTTQQCGKCRAVFYCSTAHQRKHWKRGHRVQCMQPATLVPYEDARGRQVATSAELRRSFTYGETYSRISQLRLKAEKAPAPASFIGTALGFLSWHPSRTRRAVRRICISSFCGWKTALACCVVLLAIGLYPVIAERRLMAQAIAEQSMRMAITEGNPVKIKHWLDYGIHPYESELYGRGALCDAVSEMLLTERPLAVAARVLQPFLDHRPKIDLNRPLCSGSSPLQHSLHEPRGMFASNEYALTVKSAQAVLQRRDLAVQMLLEAGADPKSRCSQADVDAGRCGDPMPLIFSVTSGSGVIHRGWQTQWVNSTALDIAVLDMLIDHGGDIQEQMLARSSSVNIQRKPGSSDADHRAVMGANIVCWAVGVVRADLIDTIFELGADPLQKCSLADGTQFALPVDIINDQRNCIATTVKNFDFDRGSAFRWCQHLLGALFRQSMRRYVELPPDDERHILLSAFLGRMVHRDVDDWGGRAFARANN